MDELDDIDEEDRFNARLRENLALDPAAKKRRLRTVDTQARKEHDPSLDNWRDECPQPRWHPETPDGGPSSPSERFYNIKRGTPKRGTP